MPVTADRLALSTTDALGLCLALAFVLFSLTGLPAVWRNEVEYFHRVPVLWLWPHALWRGWVRAIPSGAITAAAFAVLIALAYAIPVRILEWTFLLGSVAVLCLGLLLMASVSLFARPNCVIAPPLRDQPGALSEWFGKGQPSPEEAGRDPSRPRFLDSS